MRAMTEDEGVGYITRDNNVGFKAGNLRNAMEQSAGDFIIICDADTRPMPTMLERCMGYFRDPDVAWVQTPAKGSTISLKAHPYPRPWRAASARSAAGLGQGVEAVLGPIRVGQDPFLNDPEMFYQIILAAAELGPMRPSAAARAHHPARGGDAGGARRLCDDVLRRAGVDAGAVRKITRKRSWVRRCSRPWSAGALRSRSSRPTVPRLRGHLHVHRASRRSVRRWKSVLHPWIECKMLSPQDLLSWTVQRFKYAGGSLDILFHDNPLFRGKMTFWQRVMYGATFWSYLARLWNVVFLVAPIVYLTTGIAPVAAYTTDFYIHILPFLIMNELASMVGTWGISGYRSKLWYISFFPINLRALWTVAPGREDQVPRSRPRCASRATSPGSWRRRSPSWS
jgi:cellulose synthase (UDP-forming)